LHENFATYHNGIQEIEFSADGMISIRFDHKPKTNNPDGRDKCLFRKISLKKEKNSASH